MGCLGGMVHHRENDGVPLGFREAKSRAECELRQEFMDKGCRLVSSALGILI